MLPILLVLTLSVFQTVVAHSSAEKLYFLNKRQTATTAALADLIDGPVSYVTTECTTVCASMVTQSNSCTDDECACAASGVTVTCMNCEITAGSARATILAGFDAYANTCVSEGYLTAVPTLTTATATTSSASASVSSSSSSSASSSMQSSSSAVISSSTSSQAAAATTTASATGLTAINTWLTSVGTSACVSDCVAIRSDIAACTTDTCACTQTIIDDGQTCESCVELNEEGYFGNTQITQIEALWKTAENTCSLTTTLTTAAAASSSSSSSSSSSVSSTTTKKKSTSTMTSSSLSDTGIPFQSYYSPTTTTTATTTSGVIAQATSTSTSGASPGVRPIDGLDRWVAFLLVLGSLGVFWV